LSDAKKIIIISDQANNMRSGEMLHFFLGPTSHLRERIKCPIFISFFGACHGKSDLDGYFGRISKALNVLRLSICMNSTEELVQFLTNAFQSYETEQQKYFFYQFFFFFFFSFFFFKML
jgi:hypothetical protein